MNKSKLFSLESIIIFLLLLMPILDLIFPAKIEGVNRILPIALKSIILFLLIFYFIFFRKNIWFRFSFSRILILFITIHFTYLLISSYAYTNDFYKLSKTLIWVLGYFFFLDLGLRNFLKEKQINYMFIFWVLILFLIVLNGVTDAAFIKDYKTYSVSNFGYFLLFLFPFLFMHKNVPFRAAVFTLITVAIVISLKRGAIITYLLMLLYLLFSKNLKLISGKNFAYYIRFLIILISFLVIYSLVFTNIDIYIDKFSDFNYSDNRDFSRFGSGRGLLYYLPIERWINSNLFNFIFGYGFNATPLFYPTTGLLKASFYAHSDLVMLVHDYGLVGLIIYSTMFKRLFNIVKSVRSNSKKVSIYLLIIAIFFKSLFSGFIVYEYSIFAFAILGLIIGKHERDKMIINHNRK